MRFLLFAALLHASAIGAAAQSPLIPPPLPADQQQRLSAMPRPGSVVAESRPSIGISRRLACPADRVARALKPGGIVVVEAFHRDVTRRSSVGGAVVFESNELPKLFSSLRVLRYEDVEAKTDFGAGLARAVRLCAMKERP